MKLLILVILLCFSFVTQAEENPQVTKESTLVADSDLSFGEFRGDITTIWLPDGRKMRLLDTLVFVDPRGVVWDAPRGHIVDGATIPRGVWSLAGAPYSGKYRNASVIHDIACDRKDRNWKLVHRVFYEAMRASGVPESEARIKYFAVYNFGPRWGASRFEARLSEEEYKLLINDPEKRSAYIDDLLNIDAGTHINYGFRSTANFFKEDLSLATNYGLRSTANYVKNDAINDLMTIPYYLRLYVTIENSMMVLGGIVFLGVLINLINVIRRIWPYALGLLTILFVISLF